MSRHRSDLEDMQWWRDSAPHDKLARLKTDTDDRRGQDEMYLRLYSDRDYRQAYGLRPRGIEQAGFGLNIIRNMVDASVSMVVRSRPRISFLTSGSDWELYTKARKRERYIEAIFRGEKVHDLDMRTAKNAAIFGTGWQAILREHGRVRIENVFPGEMFIDPVEGRNGEPRCLYRSRPVDKMQLAELFPKRRREIIEAATGGGDGTYWRDVSGSQVVVTQAWHLPSGPDADDGCYAVVIPGHTLHKAKYTHDEFPFAVFRWEESPIGYHGTGLAAQLTGIQCEINQVLRVIQANVRSGGNLKVLLERGAKIVKSQLSNSLRAPVIEYTGQPPVFHTHDVVSPQIIQILQLYIEQAYNVTGISQLNAQSQTPMASMSGRARLVHENSESQRFLTTVRRYESMHVSLAQRILEAAGDLADAGTDYEVILAERDNLETIKYSEISGDEGQYDIEAESTSWLSHTKGGRIAELESLLQLQAITMEEFRTYAEVPTDVTNMHDLHRANRERLDRDVYRMLHRGKVLYPEPGMDLQYALERVQAEIMRAGTRDAPLDRVDLLRDYLEEIKDIITREQQPAAPAPGAAMPPQGAPGIGAPTAPADPGAALLPSPQPAM